jgi:hypothetical protein
MGVARAAPPADVAPADGARRAGAAVRVPAAVPAARGTASVGLQGAEPSEAAEVLVELGVSEAPAVPEATAGPEVRAGSVQAAVPAGPAIGAPAGPAIGAPAGPAIGAPAGPAIGAPAGPAYRGRRSAGMATPPGLEGGPYHPEPGAPPGARHKRSSRRRRGTVTGGLPGVAGTGLGRGATAPLGPGATAPLVPGATAPLVPGATAREIARGRTRRTDPTPGPFRARSAGRRRRAETCGRASPGRRGPIGRAARGQASNA